VEDFRLRTLGLRFRYTFFIPRTLFGPYAAERCGPRGNGPQHEITNLARSGTPRDAQDQLEVLAGAISWGFKSPLSAPHQKPP
jgi:hypothetical protein